MLTAALFLAALLDQRPAIVAVPFQDDAAHADALTSAVDGALYAAATAHGLRAPRVDSVFGVKQQLVACADDACRAKVAARLGARFVIVGAVSRGAAEDELRLAIVDQSGARLAGMAVAGKGPKLVAQVPALVDTLVALATAPPVQVASAEPEPALFDPTAARWDADAAEWYLP